MRTIDTRNINVYDILVATYNADPFNVEDANAYDSIAATLAKAGTVDVLTSDDDDFDTWAARLDYTADNAPAEIYVVNGNELAFAMTPSAGVTVAQLEASHLPYYTFGGVPGILISHETATANHVSLNKLKSAGGKVFLPLRYVSAAIVANPDNLERIDSDLYGGCTSAGDEIIATMCRNFENDQKVEHRWEDKELAAVDAAEMWLNTMTDSHYDWKSELTRTLEGIKAGQDMESEWNNAVATLSCKGMSFTPKTYTELVELSKHI